MQDESPARLTAACTAAWKAYSFISMERSDIGGLLGGGLMLQIDIVESQKYAKSLGELDQTTSDIRRNGLASLVVGDVALRNANP